MFFKCIFCARYCVMHFTSIAIIIINTVNGGAVVKNPPANATDTEDSSSISESGRSPGVGNGSPL